MCLTSFVPVTTESSMAGQAKKKATRKKASRGKAGYIPPDTRLNGLDAKELEGVKTIILLSLCEKWDREEAARKAGLSNRELSLLLSQDEDFRGKVEAVKKSDDLSIADLAKGNLKEGLLWRGKDGQVNTVLTIYANKAFGGYAESRKIQHVKDEKRVDPFPEGAYDKPEGIPDKVAMKPKPEKEKVPLPPEEDYEGNVLPISFSK